MSGWLTNPRTVELHARNTQHDRDPAAGSFGSDAPQRPRPLESATRPTSFCASSADIVAMPQPSAHGLLTTGRSSPGSVSVEKVLPRSINRILSSRHTRVLTPGSSTDPDRLPPYYLLLVRDSTFKFRPSKVSLFFATVNYVSQSFFAKVSTPCLRSCLQHCTCYRASSWLHRRRQIPERQTPSLANRGRVPLCTVHPADR